MSAPSYDELLRTVAEQTDWVDDQSCGCCASPVCRYCGVRAKWTDDWSRQDADHKDGCLYVRSVQHLPHHEAMTTTDTEDGS